MYDIQGTVTLLKRIMLDGIGYLLHDVRRQGPKFEDSAINKHFHYEFLQGALMDLQTSSHHPTVVISP